ncbi:MAG: aerotolerance regulator BatC [Bacteroidaceae bacterium]|nr:aerotolerance regulator BatC [Bacteroidaceae bacterium]
MKKYCLYIIICCSVCLSALAQNNDRDYIRMGNRAFRAEQYDKAETYYLKALAKEHSYEAFYNLGNAYLLQGKDSIGASKYLNADSVGTTNQMKRAMNFHNLGNVWYAQGTSLLKSNQDATSAFQNAVNLYKSSLRCNPDDHQTRYNLAMAMHQLKKSQDNNNQKQQGGGNDNKDKDKKEDKKDEQQQQQQQKKEEKNQMSEQAAEQLLNSAQHDEKNVQRKVKHQNANRKSLEKDW